MLAALLTNLDTGGSAAPDYGARNAKKRAEVHKLAEELETAYRDAQASPERDKAESVVAPYKTRRKVKTADRVAIEPAVDWEAMALDYQDPDKGEAIRVFLELRRRNRALLLLLMDMP